MKYQRYCCTLGYFLIVFQSYAFIFFNATDEDVQSPQFLSKVKQNYARVINCLLMGRETNTSLVNYLNQIQFPSDALSHYEDIKNGTKLFYERDPHYYSSYDGPWIENHWVTSFSKLPLSYFGGFFPIFAQWVDSQVNDNTEHKIKYHAKIKEFVKLLRPNVMYITLTQHDEGLGPLTVRFPNILMISAGGYGHIPIPLIKRHINYYPITTKFKYEFSFSGNLRKNTETGRRGQILQKFEDYCARNHVPCAIQGYGKRWFENLLETRFNLAPRGFGRNSFRFTEIIQAGRLPVLLHDEGLPWIPYAGTNISVENFGFYGILLNDVQSIDKVIQDTTNITESEFQRKLAVVKDVHYHYTYEGVISQINEFFSEPFGSKGGYLRCAVLPSTYV